MNQSLPFKVSVLVFIKNEAQEFLLLKRAKAPNLGLWSPIGGKVETHLGESPHECAIRETLEETGLQIKVEDLHLFAMISEKAYESSGHWLLFLFNCIKPINYLPESIEEGDFAFFNRQVIQELTIPGTDHQTLWQTFDQYHRDFACFRLELDLPRESKLVLEEPFKLCHNNPY